VGTADRQTGVCAMLVADITDFSSPARDEEIRQNTKPDAQR
jgi:hypothetical protein